MEEKKTNQQSRVAESEIIIDSVQPYRENYQMRMLKNNRIPGLLRVSGCGMEGASRYYYHTGHSQSLETYYKNKDIRAEEILKLTRQFLSVMEKMKDYMLEPNYLMLSEKYIFEKNETGGDNNTYEWVAAGVTPEKEDLQDLPPEVCASWYQKFSENKHIMIEDLEKIREDDPALYHVLHKQNISSLVVVPLYDNGKAFAFYGIDNPPAASLEYTSGILHIMGHFIVAALKRRNLVRQLQDMSLRDELTGLGNRHALHLFTEKNDHYASVGIVYCDITGLKAANDSKGHLFGDRLISNAGLCLQKAFDGYGLFRVGGDELLVICPDISHELLEEKVAMLRRLTKEYEVNLAIGYCWNDQNASAINIWMAKAESAMYQEKSAYYKAKGIEHR